MKKKFLVLIEDDFEIMGNGLGNVADLQYLPSLALMNIAEKFGVKLTFMVDVAHQLTLKKYCKHPEVKIQSKLWDETVLLMIERGFDVQLHLHPQWVNSVYKDGYFHLTDVWNIGRLLPEEQTALITDSVVYLESLLRPVRPEYDVCAFKGGAWGLQPSTHLMSELGKAGIHIIMGPRDGMLVKQQGLDYTGMEEKVLPYYPNHDDLTKIADAGGKSVVIPLQSYYPDLLTFSKYVFNHIFSKLSSNKTLEYYHSGSIPADVRGLKPLKGKKDFTLSLHPYRTHLKMGNQPFSYLKKSFATVIGKLREYDMERIPILIESHTKQYAHNYRDIERFIAHIAENYESEVEFGDLSGYSKELQNNPDLVRSKK